MCTSFSQEDLATCSKEYRLESDLSSSPRNSVLSRSPMNRGRLGGDSEMRLKISNLLMFSELPKGASPSSNKRQS